MDRRIWIVPVNDGEAVEIARLLTEQGERVLCSSQKWGATWADLEPETQRELADFHGGEIIGIELGGGNSYGARNIDHHRYSGDDRWNPLSSLEQVAALLGLPLGRRRQLVSANDRGFIPEMEAMGASREEIADIRCQDLRAQGVTEEQERLQRIEVEAAEVHDGLYVVPSLFDPPTAHSDILYLEKHARKWLIQQPSVWSYSGPRRDQLANAGFPERHWAGGGSNSGYFGIQNPGPESKRRIMDLLRSGAVGAAY